MIVHELFYSVTDMCFPGADSGGGGGGGAPGARPPPKIVKNMIFFCVKS